MTKAFLDIHILQTVPPSNINRDDTGSPKTAVFGGVRRARVSSQAWKRAARMQFASELDPSALGMRTKRVVELVAARVEGLAPDLKEQAPALAAQALKAAKVVLKADKPASAAKAAAGTAPAPLEQAGYLLFLSASQVTKLAELAVTSARTGEAINAKDAKEAANTDHSVDVALFGRMVADAAELNVDAAAQVAHAISVHAVEPEFDYFTAVDDLKPEDSAGAGMIGTVEFNSSTLYRYATVNLSGLLKNLGTVDAAAEATRAFVKAITTSMPTGKQNTFANRTLPDAVLVALRTDFPVNLVGAFEEPVSGNGESSRLGQAVEALVAQYNAVATAYAPAAELVCLGVGKNAAPLAALATPTNIDGLAKRAVELTRQYLAAQP